MARKRSTQLPTDPAHVPLTPSEELFVSELLLDRNATRAYRAAFPTATYGAAAVQAHRMLKKPNIQAELSAARRAQQRRLRLSADRVLREIARLASSDILDLFDLETGLLRAPRQIPYNTRRAIASVKVSRERTTRRVTRNGKTSTTVSVEESVIEYRFWSKTDALQKLANHLGLNAAIPPLEAVIAMFPVAMQPQLSELLTARANARLRPSTNGNGCHELGPA